MKKKMVGALLVAAMTVTTLAGCGGTKDNTPAAGSDAGEKTESSTEAASDEGTADGDETLTVWCWDPTFMFTLCSRQRQFTRKIIQTSNWTFRKRFTQTLNRA